MAAGNLLVLKDGRVGFIDFGIVGRISPLTFQAMEAFLMSTMTADYDTMARALITMGVTQDKVVVNVRFCLWRDPLVRQSVGLTLSLTLSYESQSQAFNDFVRTVCMQHSVCSTTAQSQTHSIACSKDGYSLHVQALSAAIVYVSLQHQLDINLLMKKFWLSRFALCSYSRELVHET